MNELTVIPGSISAVAAARGASIAETFTRANIVVIVDTSSSMATTDSAGGKSRYASACAELASLQNNMPGKIAVISFSDTAQFCPGGVPVNLRGGTDMASALLFARMADVPGIRFILISDGEPNSEGLALDAAQKYKNKIDTIYVGPENGEGRSFLRKLAQISGGIAAQDYRVTQLKNTITNLLAI